MITLRSIIIAIVLSQVASGPSLTPRLRILTGIPKVAIA